MYILEGLYPVVVQDARIRLKRFIFAMVPLILPQIYLDYADRVLNRRVSPNPLFSLDSTQPSGRYHCLDLKVVHVDVRAEERKAEDDW
jgi:hypothetical protein